MKILSNDSIEKEEGSKTNREKVIEKKSVTPQLKNTQSSSNDPELKTPRISNKYFIFIY